MLMRQTLLSLLDESLEISKITLSKSTVRGRTATMKILRLALQKCDYQYLSDLEESYLSVARFIDALRTMLIEGTWKGARTTISQSFSQMIAILSEIGANSRTVSMVRNSKRTMMNTIQLKTYPQETITHTEMESLLRLIRELPTRTDLVVKGCTTTKRKRLELRLYLLTAAAYALRQGTLMKLCGSDFSKYAFTYRIAKGERTGENCLRSMNESVWQAYEEYTNVHRIEADERVFVCDDWLSSATKVLMIEAGIEAPNGRHGIHRFRRAYATYCFLNNIPLEYAAAGLNHSDSSTTERVYQDVNVKQQKASEALEGFANSFIEMSSLNNRLETELREISPHLSSLLATGLPSFEDDSLEPVYIDDNGELSDYGSWSPLPDLNRGHPDVC